MKQVYTGEVRPLWPLLFAAVFTLGSALWRVCTWPLLPVDETRYLSVAWEMWLRHDWLVPHLNGSVYVDKPPVLFWLILAGWKVFGVVEWWPRLIPALAAVGALGLTARLARALWPDDPPAASAVWILTTMVWWFLWTGLVMFDLLLSTAVLLGWNALVDAPLGRGRWMWFGLAAGAGILIKGPVGLLFLLPPALLASWWREELLDGRWYGGLILSLLAAVSLVLTWFVPAVLRAGWEYGHAIGFQQTASRVIQSYAHRRPFWWYLPLLPLATLPWSLWPALYGRLLASGVRGRDRGNRFVAVAVVPAFVALCLISGKQLHYLLPLFPALALWFARRARTLQTVPRLSYVPGLILGILPLAAWAGVRWIPALAPVRSWADGVSAGWLMVPPAAAALLWAARERWRDRSFPVYWALGAGAVLLSLVCGAAPALRQHYQLAALAGQVHALQLEGHPVAWVGRYQGQLNFLGRLRCPVEEVETREAGAWARAHPDGWLLSPVTRAKGRPWADGAQCYAAGDREIVARPAPQWLEQCDPQLKDGKGSRSG